MTKYERFTNDEAKRDQLRQVLPLVIEALEALKDQLEAGKINEGIANPQIGNSYFQQIVGAKYLMDHLPALTNAPKQIKGPTPRRQFTEADRAELKRRHDQQ